MSKTNFNDKKEGGWFERLQVKTLTYVEEGYVLVLYIIMIIIRMVSKIIREVVRFPPVGCLMPATNKVSSVRSIMGSIGSN